MVKDFAVAPAAAWVAVEGGGLAAALAATAPVVAAGRQVATVVAAGSQVESVAETEA